jgi:hypothetical protein
MPTWQPAEESLDTMRLMRVLMALRKGDFPARLPLDWTGILGNMGGSWETLVTWRRLTL